MIPGGTLDYKREEPVTGWGKVKETPPRAMFVGYSRGAELIGKKDQKPQLVERTFRMSKIVKRTPSRSR